MDENFTMEIDDEPVFIECEPTIYDGCSSPRIKSRGKVNLSEVFTYLEKHEFPTTVIKKGEKANFKRQCRPFFLREDGTLMYRKKGKNDGKLQNFVEVILKRDEQEKVIRMIHQGGDTSDQACALSAHRGVIGSVREIGNRFYWPNFTKDVRDFIGTCDICQKVNHGSRLLKVVPELNPVGVPKEVMAQIGIDLASLPEVDGFRYLVVAIDYFTKWSEAKALKDKTAVSVAGFIYEIICRHGCMKIQINDQGREFVNAVSAELHRLTGVKQRLTSAYHPQANGLVERQNRTIKTSLLKVLNEHAKGWPKVIEGVLFAHRSVKHFSTGFSPFYMLYNRHPVLPIDIMKHCKDEETEDMVDDPDDNNDGVAVDDDDETPYNKEEYSALLEGILKIREQVHNQAIVNIHASQEKQKRDYNKRHSTERNLFQSGDKVLLRNLRKDSRKGGWSETTWKGPFLIQSLNKTNCSLLNPKTGKMMATRQNIANLKLFKERETQKADDDVSFVGFTDDSHLQNFLPVNASWQKEKCKLFELCLAKKHGHWSAAKKTLKAPKRVSPIIGDGNCFFRCISLLVTGTENDHGAIREKIVEHMREHAIKIDNYTQKTGYIDESKMAALGTWGTDTEILATAAWLKTNIFVYSKFGSTFKWQKFSKNGFGPKSTEEVIDERSVYIVNKSLHYEVVEDVCR